MVPARIRHPFCIALVSLTLTLMLTPRATASPPRWSKFKIYRDGYVRVEMTIPTEDSLLVNISLLGDPEYLIILNEEGLPLDFNISGRALKVFSPGSKYIFISYYTPDLTVKQNGLWLFALKEKLLNVTVFLPQDSALTSSDPLPWKVMAQNGSLVLIFQKSPISVEYALMPPPKEAEESSRQTTREEDYGLVYFVVLGLSSALAILVTLHIVRKRAKVLAILSEEEREIINIVRNRGGKVYFREIIDVLGLPKTTVWRKVKKLEELGLVRVRRTSRGLIISQK